MKQYVIEGHDGSGKTPIAKGVKSLLIKHNLRVDICAPFQIANSMIPEQDIYFYWKDPSNAKKAIGLLSGIINQCEERARKEGLDVLLYDRHWLTVLGEIDHRPKLRQLWTNFQPTFFIEAPVNKTLDCKRFSFDVPWTSSIEVITDYYYKYLRLIEKYSQYIVGRYKVESRTQPLDPIINSITDYILLDLQLQER